MYPGSQTALGEIHEPRELFLGDCMDVDWAAVVGKAGTVRFLKREQDAPRTLEDLRLGKDGLPQYYCR
jgi:hypothetical protein